MKTDGSDSGEKGKSLEKSPVKSLKDLINSDYVKSRFVEVMGEKAPAFLMSVLNAMQKNPSIAECNQNSLLSSAMVAATLDLPIDSSLGYSAIIPYRKKCVNEKKEEYYVTLAQFQIMYKGYIQLALRSGQYKTINVSPIYEDEFDSYDIVTGDIIIHPVAGGYREQENYDKIIGYTAFFRLINGFERIEYWSLSKLKAHGKKYSKSFKKANCLWKTDPHAMYAKTVLKSTLSKWGILSVTMQTAIIADQAVVKDYRKPIDSENVSYIDNAETVAEATVTPQPEQTEAENQDGDSSAAKTSQETADNGDSQGKAQATEGKKAETSNTGTAAELATQASGGDTQNGLFSQDEADALEEQYQLEQQAGLDYPDFNGGVGKK